MEGARAAASLIAFLSALPVVAQDQPKKFSFADARTVYIVALDAQSRNLSITSESLEIERKAAEQFRKEKRFKPVGSLQQAGFVFLVMTDSRSRDFDELAMAVSLSGYQTYGEKLDDLRRIALWQGSARFKRGKHAAIAGATLGYSAFFDRPSVVKGLVKQFHREIP